MVKLKHITVIALLLASSVAADAASVTFGCFGLPPSSHGDQICSWPTDVGGTASGELLGRAGAGDMPYGSIIVATQVCHGDPDGRMTVDQTAAPSAFAVVGKSGKGGDAVSEWLIGFGCSGPMYIPDAQLNAGDELHIHVQSSIPHSTWAIVWFR